MYPAIYTVWLSLHERQPAGWEYVGVNNFTRLFNMGIFAESAGHTVVFLVGYTSLTLVLGFIIALLLNRKLKLSGLYVTLLFIPWIIADIIVGIVFRLLVVPDYGLLSGILQNPAIFPPSGISVLTAARPPSWLGGFPFPPAPAMIYLIMASAWRALPFITLLLLAAMQTVSTEVIESSRMDGANGWQVVRHIMIPLMLPTLVVALFSLTLGGMNGVGMVFSLTGGGPGSATEVLSYLLYVLGWSDGNDHLFCLDAGTGKEVWRQSYPAPQYGRFAEGDKGVYSGPSSTPELDPQTGLLYTLSCDGELRCWA
ncbi:MAG: carbohydrate ABC transporter permease, partial [Caldilinea sp.]